jgi:hypothetical protein
MGLNPPFGLRASLANKFIDKALEFRPKLLILIVPPETQRYWFVSLSLSCTRTHTLTDYLVICLPLVRFDKRKLPYDLVSHIFVAFYQVR